VKRGSPGGGKLPTAVFLLPSFFANPLVIGIPATGEFVNALASRSNIYSSKSIIRIWKQVKNQKLSSVR
jgi:hypothetical protein